MCRDVPAKLFIHTFQEEFNILDIFNTIDSFSLLPTSLWLMVKKKKSFVLNYISVLNYDSRLSDQGIIYSVFIYLL